ncbi:nucleotidyl transferase AbiEii/AbiGii toxin family protein [Polynucleobacter sp. AP-Elch-400A-B2]|uniref:nucleotidyl transferase AbiEii/AbiGii toxin family protein n=1 Tax=Polynucleobacter sp. AP-Elch-400A-B2 TaxID=2576930 RepID=UPI001BFD1CC6|nr:nucleotidyl transferase AbiEii/AbiGii toxin family protein [Polynucleobacter sp. AP-Elch-400A-B2]QWE24248.1 nucleotidyl transferase AbiEii/AbiGii toxin family protein [Polynucleobacter sp. AP-Elch-400A-B2]
MKRISDTQRLQVLDVINELELGISEFALEKDFIVTDALAGIASINNTDFDLIFCGGTCLSKAYGLLERVSEDVDIKASPKSTEALTNSKVKSRMSKLKADIELALNNAGFKSEFISRNAKDRNNFIEFDIQYSTHFEVSPGMRANLKLEVSYSPLRAPKRDRAITLLFDSLAGMNTGPSFMVPCVDLSEALAEKLITFPRRLALSMAKDDEGLDTALVRHLYDVYQIIQKNSSILSDNQDNLSNLVNQVIQKDAEDFASQHSAFVTDPLGEIHKAMEYAKSDAKTKEIYDQFIRVMVYDKNAPSFEDALSAFHRTLKLALPSLSR